MRCYLDWSQFEFHSPEPRPVGGARWEPNDASVTSLVVLVKKDQAVKQLLVSQEIFYENNRNSTVRLHFKEYLLFKGLQFTVEISMPFRR